AMTSFPDFDIVRHDYVHEPGSIANKLVADVVAADLVVADLTGLSSSGYYQLGLRTANQLPLVLILEEDYVVTVSPAEFNFVRYAFNRANNGPADNHTINELSEAIRAALELRPKHTGGASLPITANAKERRNELAD